GRSLWDWLARHQRLCSAITGINAAVVGVLAAALYNPVWTSAVHDGAGAALNLLEKRAAAVFRTSPSSPGAKGAAFAACAAVGMARSGGRRQPPRTGHPSSQTVG